MPDDHALSYLSYGDEAKGGYSDSVAYDLEPPTTDPTKKSTRTAPVLVYASLATLDTHAARLAHQRGARLSQISLWPQGLRLTLPKQLRYGIWTKQLQGDLTHLLFAHPASIASTVAPYSAFYLIRPPHETEIPSIPPPAFYEFLNRTTSIPMKPTWTPFLWSLMQSEGWVSLCPGYRSHVLRCAPDHTLLLTRIQNALRARHLT